MDPFRDELAAAHARIAVLEATLEQIRPSRTVSTWRRAGLVGSFFIILVGLAKLPIEPPPLISTSPPSAPTRVWRDHLPYAWNDPYTPVKIQRASTVSPVSSSADERRTFSR